MDRNTTRPEPTRRGGDDMQFDFLDIASHELRAPVSALSGQVQLMQWRFRKDTAYAVDISDINKIAYQVERMNNMIDVYLSVTHLAQGRFLVQPTRCDVVAVARRIVGIYADGLRSQIIHLECEEDEIIGMWDRKRLGELLSTLLANAIKYGQDGDVKVSLATSGGILHTTISDRGIGVIANERNRIFEAYTTGSNANDAVGAGNGLYVAREIVRLHHGQIGVRARRGSGSIFWFDLPLFPNDSGAVR
ncbi:MAG: hypothetical protein OJF49_000038 [Ktedonobacterales bacterium]|nr:MAG: hypothetical protein OJF49_000038 [Ktedonobacterales bacterium]